jgi:hypothetical protein
LNIKNKRQRVLDENEESALKARAIDISVSGIPSLQSDRRKEMQAQSMVQ